MGHTLSVQMIDEEIKLSLECHEPERAWCRLTCPEGCETWDTFHDHELVDYGSCLAVEWSEGVGVAEAHEGGPHDLSHGMPVHVWWQSEGWMWAWRPKS